VIRFGLRLSTRGGKESLVRLVVMALAVAVGVAMLLLTMATINGLGAQNSRGAWMATSPRYENGQPTFADRGANAPTTNSRTIWWLVTSSQFENQVIVRVDAAAVGAHPVVPPGIPRLPGPGEFYASPALSALLKETPASQLGDRFGGREIGSIASTALPSPSDLVIVIGQSAHTMSHIDGAGKIDSLVKTSNNGGPDTTGTTGLQIILGILALVLLFPVLVFVGSAMRLSAARREQRFAAIRLAGATMRQVTVIATIEALVAALAGVAIGLSLYFLSEPALVHVPFTGHPLQAGDLRIGLVDVLVVTIGVPFAAAIAARIALRRVQVSPLGVSRRVTPRPPRWYRVLPLLAGVGELGYFESVGRPTSSGAQTEAYLLGFFLIMVGLVLAGPWLTMAGSKSVARRTSRVSLLLAGRRLSDNPRGSFRAVSGLILAIFVTSVSVGVISTILADHGTTSSNSLASKTVVDQFAFSNNGDISRLPTGLDASLRSIRGVTGVTTVYVAPARLHIDGRVPDVNGLGGSIQHGLATCAALASTPALGQCRPHATYAVLGDDIAFVQLTKSVTADASIVWPSARLATSAHRLPVQLLAVATNGSTATINRVETALDRTFPYNTSSSLFGEVNAQSSQLLNELETSSEVVILASLLIAGCSLTIAMAAGISERRRPFSLLRLSGVPLGVLQRMVALETAGPMLVISIASALIGLVASELFLRSQLGLTLRPPGAVYYLIVVGGLVGALAIMGSTLPLLDRVTRPEDARTE
jgi:FtsX-like permease family protein